MVKALTIVVSQQQRAGHAANGAAATAPAPAPAPLQLDNIFPLRSPVAVRALEGLLADNVAVRERVVSYMYKIETHLIYSGLLLPLATSKV